MTFNHFFKSVKKKFNVHKEIILDCDKLSVQITDINNNSFYILWENGELSLEPYPYNDYNVCITSSQDHLELLFEERQYIFVGQKNLNIIGSFTDVMMFQKLLSFITKDNGLSVQEEIISNMMYKQDMITKDLSMVMESLQLLLVNSIIDIPVKAAKNVTENIEKNGEKITSTTTSTTKRKTTRKKATSEVSNSGTKSTKTPSSRRKNNNK